MSLGGPGNEFLPGTPSPVVVAYGSIGMRKCMHKLSAAFGMELEGTLTLVATANEYAPVHRTRRYVNINHYENRVSTGGRWVWAD